MTQHECPGIKPMGDMLAYLYSIALKKETDDPDIMTAGERARSRGYVIHAGGNVLLSNAGKKLLEEQGVWNETDSQ